MNAVYKLIWNVSTGTWAVAHELAASRGKKTGRSRLAAAMTVALALPAGAAFAADSPAELQCKANESVSADGLRCEVSPVSNSLASRIGVMAPTPTDSYEAGGGVTQGERSIAIGSGATTKRAQTDIPTDAIAIGYKAQVTDGQVMSPTGAIAIGSEANVSGGGSISIGRGSVGYGTGSTVLGDGARANWGTAIGAGALVSSSGGVALGGGSVANRGNAVSIGSTGKPGDPDLTRQLIFLRAGTADTDAVNVSQLKPVINGLGGGASIDPTTGVVTGPSYTIGGAQFNDVGAALGNLDGRVNGNTTNLGDITTRVTNLENSGGPGLVERNATTGEITVASKEVGGDVNLRDANGDTRTLTGVKGGTTRTDAANFGQLTDTASSVAAALGGGSTVGADGTVTAPSYSIGGSDHASVGDAFDAVDTSLDNLNGRVGTVENNVTNLQGDITKLTNGTVGVVKYDDTKKEVNVATDKGGETVNFAGTDGARTLAGVKAGVADTDAANFGQLKGTAQSIADGLGGGSVVNPDGTVTAPSYTVGGTTVTNVGEAITNIDGRTTTNTGDISNLTTVVNNLQAGVGGIVSYDAPTGTVQVAKVQAGDKVDFAGTAGDRTLAGVKAGVADNDAANVGQLKGTAQSIADGLGGGSVVNADGTISAPSYSIGGSDYTNVGDAFGAVNTSLTNLDGRVTVNEGNITKINTRLDGLADGTDGVVTYDATTNEVNVATGKEGAKVNFAGTDGARVLAGVADGKVEDGSDEAVNGSQLNATNERVAANETSITNLDGRVTTNEGDINKLTTQVTNLSNGSAGLVTQDALTGNINVASQLGGDVVDVAGTAGARRVGGVANGVDDTDAATVAQLKASGLVDPNDGRALGALVYDDLTLDRATLGGTNGTVIGNLGNGLIAAGSREAVNGGQLFQMNADWEAKWSQLDGRVGTIEQGIADGSIGGGSGGGSGGDAGNGLVGPGAGEGSLVVGDGSADGTGSVAVGGGAAGGEGSVAIGGDSSATGDNSVAIGNGSTADRDNEFSVGSEGNERIVSNVGAGVRPTDAVNVQQMNDRFEAERKYVDDRFHSVDKRFDRMGAMSSAYAGMAINTAGLSGDNRVGAGVGAQNGRTALAVGYQRILGEKKNVSLSLGGAFSGSDKSVSAGAGYSW